MLPTHGVRHVTRLWGPVRRGPARAYTTNVLQNQQMPTSNDHRLEFLMQQFDARVRYTFGYGLGVFEQAGYKKASRPQIDMVHVVDEPVEFHTANAAQHPQHYLGLLRLGIPTVLRVQQWGAGVYFNPFVTVADHMGNELVIKYGVVLTEAAMDDIEGWLLLYIAGRLQKPVKHLRGDDTLRAANQYNLQSALNLLVLLLGLGPRNFTERALYEKIALLSYMGDPRMVVGGENPNKVRNIVSRQLGKFRQLYGPAVDAAHQQGHLARQGGTYRCAATGDMAAQIIHGLPVHFRRRLLRAYKRKYERQLLQEGDTAAFVAGRSPHMAPDSGFLAAVAGDVHLRSTLKNTVLATIAYPAFVQLVKGIFTAGLVKSAKYAWEKKVKSWGQ